MKSADEKTRAFLEDLLITPSPAGFEKAGQQIWLDYVRAFADHTETDAYGSAAAHLRCAEKEAITVMLEAHCDEIGMIVQHIDEAGFVYVGRVGGSDPAIARARRVNIHSREGTVSGITGNTAIHLQDKKDVKVPKWHDIFVDIGVSSREEALGIIQIGDPITMADQHELLSDDIIAGRALDNRMGGYMIARVLEELSSRRSDLPVNVVALNAVQEEVGGFGARMMAYRYEPDVAIVTDVTHATDTPGINHKEHGLIKLGKGPVINHGGANHPAVQMHLENAAKTIGADIQHEATGIRTGTDTDSIFYQKKGIPSGLISLPLRYMHSPVEMASISDAEQLMDVMVAAVLRMKKDQKFAVI